MPEDPTKDLTIDEMLRALLADMREVKGRLSALETQGEDGVKTTRPLLNQLIKEMTDTRDMLTARIDTLTDHVAAVEKELRAINYQLDAFGSNWMRTQGTIRE